MPAVDFGELAIEESPNSETSFASAIAPTRKSTNLVYPAARTIRVAPSPQHLARADEMRGIRGEVSRLIETYEPVGVLTARAYADLLAFILPLAGFTYTYTAGGAAVAGPAATTATGVNALNSAIVNVGDTSEFPASGSFVLGGVATTYTGKTPTSFTGCGNHVATVGGETINDLVPAGANKWVYTKRQGIDAKTARIRTNYADENVLLEGYGFAVSSLQIPASGELSADLMGLFMRRLAADTVTVPSIQASSVPPFRRAELIISALAGGGRIGDFGITITNPLERIKSMSQSIPSDWPDAMEFGDEEVAVTGTLPKRILAGADLDALIAATTFQLTAKWISRKMIVGTTPYRLYVDCPKAQYVGGEQDELAGAKRRFGFNPDWFASWDETAGYDCKITLINGVSAVETYV